MPATKFIELAEAHDVVAGVFSNLGCSAIEANRIAVRLAGANLRGHDSHGIIRVPRYALYLKSNFLQPDQTVEIISENDVIAVVDGRFGFGQTIGEQAVDIGIAKAQKNGVSIIALRNSGHLGRIGDWAERAADANLISINVANVSGSQLVAPFGGKDRRFSTSPFCIGVPLPGDDPIILDFATSSVAEGKALVALKSGETLPDGTFVDGNGELSGDPLTLYGPQRENVLANANSGSGALRAFGEHKGSGLNFMIELLAGALTESGAPNKTIDPKNRKVWNGMLSIYLSADYFRSADDFARDVRSFVEFVKSSDPVDGGEDVLTPGEKERRVMAERLKTGLPIEASIWSEITQLLAATAQYRGA